MVLTPPAYAQTSKLRQKLSETFPELSGCAGRGPTGSGTCTTAGLGLFAQTHVECTDDKLLARCHLGSGKHFDLLPLLIEHEDTVR